MRVHIKQSKEVIIIKFEVNIIARGEGNNFAQGYRF